jgi:hypothetical protein
MTTYLDCFFCLLSRRVKVPKVLVNDGFQRKVLNAKSSHDPTCGRPVNMFLTGKFNFTEMRSGTHSGTLLHVTCHFEGAFPPCHSEGAERVLNEVKEESHLMGSATERQW